MEAASSPISDPQRQDLQQRLVDNFHALLFHREGYRPSHVPQELIEQIAVVVEAKAFLHVVRAAELGMSSRQMVQTYAKEAATLLLAEVERYTLPQEVAGGASHSGNSVDMQQLSLNEFSGGLRSIQTAPSSGQHRPNRPHDTAWGWLVPGSRMLPYVVLKGAGVAIGRGKEALWAIGGASSATHSTHGTPRTCLASGNDKHLTEVLKRNLGFVEVADGRVSRLHCIISLGPAAGGHPHLEDCSSNGTFLNHRKLAKGESVPLEDGDRISLVLSVAPLVEQYFVFRCGDPRDPELAGSDEHSWVGSTHSPAGVFSPGAMHSASPSGTRPSSAAIFRTATSRYTTAEQSTLEDLKCQICLNTLRQCVALEPCGHNFCATCLSHHLGNSLQGGLQLSCPFRCPPPERIIINYAVRALIDLLSSNSRSLSGALASRAGSMGTAVAAAAVGGNGAAAARSNRAGGPMTSAFGQAPGSYSNLTGLVATPSAAVTPAAQQQQQQQQQQQCGTGSGSGQQQGAASPPYAGTPAAQQQGGSSTSSSIQRAASAASGSSLDGVAGSAAAAAAAAAAGLPGVAEEPASSAGDSGRSRFAQAAATAATNGNGFAPAGLSRAGSAEPDFYTQSMNVLCPLDDDCLPLEAANLKTRQVEVALSRLKDSELDHDDHLVCLEALARLAWSDDSVRQLIANTGGVASLVSVMRQHATSDSITCNGCLALMSLVRGEGEVCQSNQWHVAKAGAIEVIAEAMARFRDSAMVQLSVLLCLIPLTLENAMMQAHVTQECLGHIIAALDRHLDEVDIQTKALVLLGVLIQGDDAVHDAVRIRQLESGVPRRVAAALCNHGTGNDDVLWAALFTLAVLVRDDSVVFARAASALVSAGIFKVLEAALDEYKQRHADENTDPDEMILSAGDYLLRVLEPVQQQRLMRRYILLGAAGACSVVTAGVLIRRLWGRDSSSRKGSSIQAYQGSGSSSGGRDSIAAGSSRSSAGASLLAAGRSGV